MSAVTTGSCAAAASITGSSAALSITCSFTEPQKFYLMVADHFIVVYEEDRSTLYMNTDIFLRHGSLGQIYHFQQIPRVRRHHRLLRCRRLDHRFLEMADTDYRKSDKRGLKRNETCKTYQSFYDIVCDHAWSWRLGCAESGGIFLPAPVQEQI